MSNPLEGFSRPQKAKFIFSPMTWFAISAVSLLVTVLLLTAMGGSRSGTVGIDPGATYGALEDSAVQLTRADKAGDVAAAVAMLDPLTELMRQIDTSAKNNDAMRRCQLAAAHLADGVLSVVKGGTWTAKSRFESALISCK